MSDYRKRKDQGNQPIDFTFGHIMPQATEMEKAVLGALMIDKDAYLEVGEWLKPESFYEPRNQLVYAAIQRLSMDENPVDVLTVTNQLEKMGNLEGFHDAEEGADGADHNRRHIDHQLELAELQDIMIDCPSIQHSIFDGTEVIIQNNDFTSFFGRFCTAAHGKAYIRPLQRWRIIDTITCHRNRSSCLF